MPRKPSSEALAQAEQLGFDTNKLWFHGTRKRFDGFRLPKESGIDELGPGVYLTSEKWLANTWARERGFVLVCVARKGPMIDLATIQQPQVVAVMRRVFVQRALTSWVGDKPADAQAASEEYFDECFGRRPHRTANLCLSDAGYIGGFNRNSQIAGQVVIFKPEDVMIVARQAGKAYMTSHDA